MDGVEDRTNPSLVIVRVGDECLRVDVHERRQRGWKRPVQIPFPPSLSGSFLGAANHQDRPMRAFSIDGVLECGDVGREAGVFKIDDEASKLTVGRVVHAADDWSGQGSNGNHEPRKASGRAW